MLDTIAHRGPDDDRVEGLTHGAIGSRRLAIIDLAGGTQPRWETGQQVCVAFNGEIYNHARLRRLLEADGKAFATVSDTEVVAAMLAGYEPSRALSLMSGMFAVAAWDARRERLILGRDRVGQKPLYWTLTPNGTLVFCSELKGILRHADVRRQVDPVAVEQLLLFEYVPSPRTIYQGIHKLEPGTLLTVDRHGLHIERWWDPPLTGLGREQYGLDRWSTALGNSLQVAVKRRLLADVPVVTLLSGGIDSSAVSALAAQLASEPLHSFSVVFDEKSFDESSPARRMAEHLGTRHTEVRFRANRLPEVLDALTQGLCEPLADGSLAASWVLAEAVHGAGFKVALSGDGADEHLGGYPTYLAHRIASALAPGASLLRGIGAALPASTENLSKTYLLRRLAAGLPHPHHRRNQIWLGAWLPEELQPLLGRPPEPWAEVDRWADVAAAIPDPADRAMFLDQRLYLGEGVLTKVDRASMLHSVEVRSPFLDPNLIDVCATLPKGIRLRTRETKRVLRRAVADLLPKDILARPKKGFGTPLGPWLRGPCANLLDGLEDQLEGVCDPDIVGQIRKQHQTGQADHRRRIWSLLILARWWHGPWGPTIR
jgi:asparagine synthase (glutamine-hydrolysing)